MEILDTLALNSIPQKRHIFTTEELLQAVSYLRQITNLDTRCTMILNQISNHLDTPGMVDLLKKELEKARFTAGTADAIRHARQRLDAYAPENIQPLFPNPIKIKVTRRRKAKAKTKINSAVRIDPELARLAVATYQAATFRLWAIARDIIRQLAAKGIADNFVTTDALFLALKSFGIEYTRSNYRMLLKNGQERGFWNIAAGSIYIVGYKGVAAMLTRLAIARGIPVDQDRPGARDWYIRVSGDIGEFNAHVYAAWLASNENPTISRQTLQALWNRTRQQLQTWEGIAKIRITENYAQTTDITDTRIPDYAVSGNMRQSVESTVTAYRWQRTNTYQAPKKLREHGHKGQARKVRKTVNAVCEAEQHPDSMAGAHSLGVRNFDSLKAYRAAWRRDSRQDVPLDAHTDYLFLGGIRIRRRGKQIGIWELMGAHREPQTSAGDYEPLPRYKRAQYGSFF